MSNNKKVPDIKSTIRDEDGSVEWKGAKLQSNSDKSKKPAVEVERKPVKKVVSGAAIKKKKSFGKRVLDAFIGEDAQGTDVTSYIIYDVLIPAAKTTLSEMVTTGIEMMLFGKTAPRGNIRRDRGVSRVGYRSFYDKDDRGLTTREPSRANKIRHNFDDIVIEDKPGVNARAEAEDVLSHMADMIQDYQQCTVEDFYDFVGITSDYTDKSYGWYNLGGASVSRVRGGYVINLPRAVWLE